jgi:hypothetical protein
MYSPRATAAAAEPADALAAEPAEALAAEPFSEDAIDPGGFSDLGGTVGQVGSLQRLVIELPGSPSYQQTAATPRAKPATRQIRPRRIAPQRWQSPTRSSTRRGPDQWLRTSKP